MATVFSSCGGHFAFINNFDGFLVYYKKFNRQKFDISLYSPKVIKFLSYDLIFGSVGCEITSRAKYKVQNQNILVYFLSYKHVS